MRWAYREPQGGIPLSCHQLVWQAKSWPNHHHKPFKHHPRVAAKPRRARNIPHLTLPCLKQSPGDCTPDSWEVCCLPPNKITEKPKKSAIFINILSHQAQGAPRRVAWVRTLEIQARGDKSRLKKGIQLRNFITDPILVFDFIPGLEPSEINPET